MTATVLSNLSSFSKGENVLVITGCSKSKLNTQHPVPAEELYTGTLFQSVRRFAADRGYTLAVISAKYGFIPATKLLCPYDMVLKTNGDIERIKPQVTTEVQAVLSTYDKVLVISGEMYRRTLKDVEDERFFYLKTKGIGYLLQELKRVTE